MVITNAYIAVIIHNNDITMIVIASTITSAMGGGSNDCLG